MLTSINKCCARAVSVVLIGPQLGRSPQFDCWRRVLLVKQLVFALVKTVEFSLDNADARCTGYNRCRLRIRFYM